MKHSLFLGIIQYSFHLTIFPSEIIQYLFYLKKLKLIKFLKGARTKQFLHQSQNSIKFAAELPSNVESIWPIRNYYLDFHVV